MAWNIAYFNAPVAAGAGNGVPAGVFIPRTALPGITASAELTDANRERKVAYALATQLYERLNAIPNKLGLTVSRPTPAGVADNRINQSFSLTTQFYVDHTAGTVNPITLPDDNTGRVTLPDVFPGSSVVAAEAAVPEAGIIVPNGVITALGGLAPSSTNEDVRSWINALYHSMVFDLEPSTALVSTSRGAAVGFVPPNNFTGIGGVSAITGIGDLQTASFFSITYSLTLQLQLNQTAQTFDLAA